MRFQVLFQAALALGAAFAVVGAGALAVCRLVDPDMPLLPRLEEVYRLGLQGFVSVAACTVAAAVADLFPRLGRPATAPAPDPAPADPVPAPAPAAAPSGNRLASLYHEMRTFVDLEMWELALEKANAIVKDFPGSREAELVSRNLNEIRWKAEPKFVAQTAPLSADQERELREKGLTAMLQHVRTYMDLEMWELARQKALALIKAFPDSPEAAELMKVFETLERKARGSAEPAAKA